MCRQDGGCPECNPELARVWAMRDDSQFTARWLTQSQQRLAAARNLRLGELRVGVHAVEDTEDDTGDRLASMAAFRGEVYAALTPAPATERASLEAPDPYAAALQHLSKGLQ